MLDRKSLDHITISEKLILFISNLRQKPKAVRWAFWIMITIISFYSLFIPLIILPICFIVVLARTHKYYKTDEFRNLSSRIKKQIDEYNEFDNFMQETRQFIFDKQKELSDTNFRDSSLTIYKNSKLNPYGYIVKYFFKDKKVDESTMQTIEQVMQKYETIQKTYSILEDEYLEIMNFVNKKMYIGAYVFKKTTMRNLGSRVLPKFNKDYYMQYSFSSCHQQIGISVLMTLS